MISKTQLKLFENWLSQGDLSPKYEEAVEDYLTRNERQKLCTECNERIVDVVKDEAGEKVAVCSSGEHATDASLYETDTWSLDAERLLSDIVADLGYNPSDSTAKYPEAHVSCGSEEGTTFVLITDGSKTEKVLEKIYSTAISEKQVFVVITPTQQEEVALRVSRKYALGSLSPTIPISLCHESPDVVQELIKSAELATERSITLSDASSWSSSEIEAMDTNPRLIQTKLEQMVVKRRVGYKSGTLGDILEDVGKAAFGHLGFRPLQEFGGKSGQNETDIAFQLPKAQPSAFAEHDDSILGIVDTKSGAETNLSSELIAQKHLNYLKQANGPAFTDCHISHIFVVLSMDGLASNEIDWYDEIEKEYSRGRDATMTVLHADALSQMLDARLSVIQNTEADQSVEGGLTRAFRPFFHYRLFRKINEDIQHMTRVSPPANDEQKSYEMKYLSRERLIVVTKEMVDARLREIFDEDEIRTLLSEYPYDR